MYKKLNYIFLILLFLLPSCGDTMSSLKRGLTGEKQKSSEEFLVRKKDPLILPPDYENLPLPQKREEIVQDQSTFKNLILKENSTSTENSSTNSRPPGAKTRWNSRIAASGEVTLRMPKAMLKMSKLPDSKGRSMASPRT